MWENVRKIFGIAEPIEVTEEYKDILKDFEDGANLFVTGKAGSGKSRLIDFIRTSTKKKVIVLAPTGLAALNVRGQTIHSFFKFAPRILTRDVLNRTRIDEEVFKQIETVIIDEASMIRADVMDGIDRILRRAGKDAKLPFGGVQVMLVGDVYQLPPVVNNEEREIFEMNYESPYFFDTQAYRQGDFQVKVLTKMFRQAEEKFINALNSIRLAETNEEQLEIINSRVGKKHELGEAVLLGATNRLVNEINLMELAKLGGKERTYEASFEGDFPHEDKALPVETSLKLKKGARVVFLKNGAGWVNGSMGVAEKLEDEFVSIRLDANNEVVEVGTEEWNNVVYKLSKESGEIEEHKTGTMRQIPLRLAWAVTIHKSQGMSFDKVIIDFARSPFAHGQTYVALSRCRTLKGLALTRRVYPNDLIVDPRVVEFASRFS